MAGEGFLDNSPPSISVVMPVYNEEQGVESAVRRTLATFEEMIPDFELILVDDKSTDRTGEILDRLADQHPRIRCRHHVVNQGIGGAFRTGVADSTKEYIILIPVDNPLMPSDLEAYLPRMKICDVVVGVRVERIGYTPVARCASFIYNRVLVPLLFNIGVSDVNWIQAYRRSLFTDGLIVIEHPGIVFLVEILVQARRHRVIIGEVPARMQKRFYGRPSCFRWSVMWRTFWAMVDLFLNPRKRQEQA